MATSLSFATEHSRLMLLITNPKGQMILAVISLCAIIVFNSFFYLFRPYNGMGLYNENPLGEVYIVFPGGPAEAPG